MNQLLKLIELEQDARKFGFDWPNQFMILDQVIDECREVREEDENILLGFLKWHSGISSDP